MVDVSKIKVGDDVSLRGRVIEIDRNDPHDFLRVTFARCTLWAARGDISEHHPQPRGFKVGDKVRVPLTTDLVYEIRAISDGYAICKSVKGNINLLPLEHMEHVDD